MHGVFGPLRDLLITAALWIVAVGCIYLWLAASPLWGVLYGVVVTVALVRIRPARRGPAGEPNGEPLRRD